MAHFEVWPRYSKYVCNINNEQIEVLEDSFLLLYHLFKINSVRATGNTQEIKKGCLKFYRELPGMTNRGCYSTKQPLPHSCTSAGV